jgi:hypothetical protein
MATKGRGGGPAPCYSWWWSSIIREEANVDNDLRRLPTAVDAVAGRDEWLTGRRNLNSLNLFLYIILFIIDFIIIYLSLNYYFFNFIIKSFIFCIEFLNY